MSIQMKTSTTPASRLLDAAPAVEETIAAAPERGTVLVVEDDRDLAETYAIWLDREYDVRTASDARSARAAMDDGVDVVLTDRRLPDGDGADVAADVRAVRPSCLVAFITAVEPGVDLVELPADSYVEKPVTEADVTGTVEELLARTRFGDDLREYFATTTKLDVLRERGLPDGVEEAAGEDPALCGLRERYAEERDAVGDDLREFLQ